MSIFKALRVAASSVTILMFGCVPRAYKDLDDLGFVTLERDWRIVSFNVARPPTDEDIIQALPLLRKIRARSIILYGQHISDRSIPYIIEILSIEELDLSGTDVTIAGLLRLSSLPKLKQLYISKSHYTSQDLELLTKSLPNTQIEEDWLGTNWRQQSPQEPFMRGLNRNRSN